MSEGKTFYLGFFGVFSILAGLLIFMWLLMFQPPDPVPLVTASFFIVGGVALAFTLTGTKIEPFGIRNIAQTILSMGVNMAVIYYLNRMVPLQVSETFGLDPRIWGYLWGVAEECFFRVFLCTFFYRVTGSSLIAIVASSAIWTSWHAPKFGGNLNYLFLVFLCGLVLGFTQIFMRSGDGNVMGHGLINYVAYA